MVKDAIKAFDFEIRSIAICDSTNDFVSDLLGFYEKAVVLSIVQEKGRGTKGHEWFSPEGGIWLSIGYKITTEVQELSTPVVKAVNKILRGYVDCQIKPPNDILIGTQKVAGILVEAKVSDNMLSEVIVGIGINVINDLTPDLQGLATRLEDHGKIPSIPVLASEVALEVIATLNSIFGT